MANRFEQFLNTDDNLYLTDAISINGQLYHEEKALFLKLFMGDKNPMQEVDIQILLAMSGVVNAGIDCSSEIYSAVRLELSPSINGYLSGDG